ncbi:hypothetical protein [Streptomyces sp. MNP-20]|uniref:hypothetical protein n=1 Tax=Streptomyces sp. MNP-20 TaxID=2721165 RepID=UPI0015542F50|nr:hypothetical protein [Streptomyces sp. MNP-20]
MSPDLIAAIVLAAPGALGGTLALAGHHRARRHDATAAAVLATYRPAPPDTDPDLGPGGPGPGEPTPVPGRLAPVIDLHTRRRTAA